MENDKYRGGTFFADAERIGWRQVRRARRHLEFIYMPTYNKHAYYFQKSFEMKTFQIPERDIGFLLVDVARLMRRDFDRRISSTRLTQAQWRAIGHLAREEGVRQTVLAERLEVKPITLGRLIDRMEATGWVSRRADPTDRRAVLLYLTPKVQPILAEIQARAAEAHEVLFQGMPPAERQMLAKTLERMKNNLLAAEADGLDHDKE
jgi:MarR family transcriptional regulator for hemolysin